LNKDEEFLRKHPFMLRYNPEYMPLTGPVFQTDAQGNVHNTLLPALPTNKIRFRFPDEASVLLKMTWRDTWSFAKVAGITGALEGERGNTTILREALEILRGERLPCPDVVRKFWERQGAQPWN
jgi:hypothetical protein